MFDNCGEAITNVGELLQAAVDKKAVIVPRSAPFSKPRPAGFLINMQGGRLYPLFRAGMYIYKKGENNNGK